MKITLGSRVKYNFILTTRVMYGSVKAIRNNLLTLEVWDNESDELVDYTVTAKRCTIV